MSGPNDETVMISHVPELLKDRGWSYNEFQAYVLLAGFSGDTARRLAAGDTNFGVETVGRIAKKVFGFNTTAKVIDLKE